MKNIPGNTFFVFFAILIVYVASDLISQIADMKSGREWYLTAKIGLFVSLLSSAMLIPLLTSFLLYSCGEGDERRTPALLTNVFLLVIYTGLLIYTQFSKTIYYYDDQAVYHRESEPGVGTTVSILLQRRSAKE